MNIEFNVIATFDIECKHILMCKRRNNPYKGLYNLVGGKIESGEEGSHRPPQNVGLLHSM